MLAAGSARREVGGAGGTPRRDWHRQDFACPRDPQFFGTRAKRPFIAFNASAISDTLLESQLFGHERGAFTGAQQSVKGKFELADSGTLFLDEISEMSPLAQVKILRVLEYGEFERLGSERMLTSNARIIWAIKLFAAGDECGRENSGKTFISV